MYSFIENGMKPHCVLVLIGYRIDLLLIVPTNRIVTFLLKKNKNITNINPFSERIH